MSNLYRPAFAYHTPRGFRDETFHYSFNGSNVAALGTAIAAGALVADIILQLQNDADFVCRGLKVLLGTVPSNLYLWLKDPFGNYLSQTYVPASLSVSGSGSGVCGSLVVPIEEIICPASGMWTAYLYNPTAAPVNPPAFSFFGVKRYPLEAAA
jgi:hypothetical protein